jgi:DNA-binding transcriptional MerR regulator
MSRSSSPNGSLLTVAELARSSGVAAHVVRFYARTGLIQASRYTANGYRHFVPLDVKRVRFIRVAQSLGFTLAEVRQVMHHSRLGRSPCPLVRDIIKQRLSENRERLRYVEALQHRMQRASERWRHMPDQTPHGDAICALIESVADEETVAARVAGKRRAFNKR